MTVLLSQLLDLSAKNFMQIVGDKCSRITYSQMGEDVIFYHLLHCHLPSVGRGFYVDCGAFHPRRYSNTKMLHMAGWRGINIDASERTINTFKQERPNDINVCVGIGPENGELTYYEFEDGAVSTFDAGMAEKWKVEKGWKLRAVKALPVRVLGELLDEVMPREVPGIDIMSIDIEGLDASVTAGLDLEKYRPKILAVELHGTDIIGCADNPAVRHLTTSGYRLVAVTLATFIFIDTRAAIGL